jgi:alpha-maltose-1-phosphate synthase
VAAWQVLRAISGSADVIICHQWRTRMTAALRAWRGRKATGTLVAMDHGGGSPLGAQLNRLQLPRVDLGAVQTEFEARVTPIQARDTCLIRGGVVQELFKPPEIEDRSYDFLMVARFLPHKGQDVFLEALPPGARALLIGPSASDDTAYRDRVRERARLLGVDVRFDCPDSELLRIYQRARYTVQVSIPQPGRRAAPPELLGLSLLEGMACGSVPICPSTGPATEFVRDGTGLTYGAGSEGDLKRVLAEAMQGEHRRAVIASNALAESSRWTWAAAARNLLMAWVESATPTGVAVQVG